VSVERSEVTETQAGIPGEYARPWVVNILKTVHSFIATYVFVDG